MNDSCTSGQVIIEGRVEFCGDITRKAKAAGKKDYIYTALQICDDADKFPQTWEIKIGNKAQGVPTFSIGDIALVKAWVNSRRVGDNIYCDLTYADSSIVTHAYRPQANAQDLANSVPADDVLENTPF